MKNEQKEKKYFVWERTTRGGMAATKQPAVYRGLPMTGMGTKADSERFVFIHEVLPEEDDWVIIEFCKKYPCPV